MKFHVLPDKFNANYNWDSLDAPGVIHYTAGNMKQFSYFVYLIRSRYIKPSNDSFDASRL